MLAHAEAGSDGATIVGYVARAPQGYGVVEVNTAGRAWRQTYGLPPITTNSSNNYGPFQFPEKLIPHMIIKAPACDPLPVYGDGQNVRDWIYAEDHVRG